MGTYQRDRVHVHRFMREHWEETLKMVELHKQFHKERNGAVKFTKLPLNAAPGTMRSIVPTIGA
jgi:hypothetical protein